MAITGKLIAVGIIIGCLVIGLVSFYILSDLSKELRKKRIEEMISQLINFVIFIWIAKVILHFSIFIKDPMSILAYPSDSNAFYLAVVMSGLSLAYKSKKNQISVLAFFDSFIYVFSIAAFLYEFVQLVVNNNPYAIGSLLVLTVLIILLLLTRERLTTNMFILLMLTVWSVGIFILSVVQPFVTVFGYMMEPWFIIVSYIITAAVIIINRRKRDVSWVE